MRENFLCVPDGRIVLSASSEKLFHIQQQSKGFSQIVRARLNTFARIHDLLEIKEV